jgi:hypothetical protein
MKKVNNILKVITHNSLKSMIPAFVSITNWAIASKNEDRLNFSAMHVKRNNSLRVRDPVPFR